MLQLIKNTLYDGYIINKSGLSFTLEETAREASCKEALFEAKFNYLILKFDSKKPVLRQGLSIDYLFPFFEDGNANAINDYLIFYEKPNGKLFAVICNLKSGSKANNADQILAGEILANFIFETTKRLHPERFEKITFKKIRVLFSSKRLYSNNKSNSFNIINLISNDTVKDKFIFENKCH